MISRFNVVPRFGLPYTPMDFATGLLAIFKRRVSPEAFELLGDSPKFWTCSGRQSLYLLLTALGLKPASGVAIPLYTDPSLVGAIVAAGHRPVFIDVEPEFLTMDPESLRNTRRAFSAVVVVHLFGQMANMPEVLKASGNVPVIEDAAHAPLSYLNGRMAGTFGSACFYSFASTKYWPAGGGGLAVVHDPLLARNVANVCRTMPAPSRMEQLHHLVLQGLKAAVFRRYLYGFVGKPLRSYAEKMALLEPSLSLETIQNAHALVASRQALRFSRRVELQRNNSLWLLSQLAGLEDVVLPRERPGARNNYHLFPVLLRNSEERRALVAEMWARFIDTSTIYSDVVQKSRRFGYRSGCPVAESLADRLITLPNHAALTTQDIDAVADAFRSSLRIYRSTQPYFRAA